MSIKVSQCCCELKRPDGEWKQFTYIKCLPSDPVLILAIEMTETCLKNYSVSLFRIVQGVLQRSMKLDTTHKLLVVRINVSSLTARRQPFRLHKYPESLLQLRISFSNYTYNKPRDRGNICHSKTVNLLVECSCLLIIFPFSRCRFLFLTRFFVCF